jgi:small subunit ribosomal protein S2
LQTLESNLESGKYEKLVKKEVLMITRRINKLNRDLGGIRDLTDLPQMLFVVDIMREYTAVHEANLKSIPVIAMVDTNCNPDTIDYLIPANDDAIRAIKLLVTKVADAVLEGKAIRKEEEELEEANKLASAEPGMDSTQSLLEEEEVSDEDLLGASTLAKISSKKEEELAVEKEKEEADTEAKAKEEVVEEVKKEVKKKAKKDPAPKEEVVKEVKKTAKKKAKKTEETADEEKKEVEKKTPAKKKSEKK